MSRDAKLTAFAEDLAAVYAKHGLCLEAVYNAAILVKPLLPSTVAVGIEQDLVRKHCLPALFLTENTREHSEEFVEVVAYVPFPKTGHGRMTAAARVAVIRAEGDKP